jgi:hypothetical protein
MAPEQAEMAPAGVGEERRLVEGQRQRNGSAYRR